MAGKNEKLSSAKKAKNDEFYTQWADIEKEIMSYYDYNPDIFRDKTVLLPCDGPEWSNFTKFFAQNFERFGLKKLISTSFAFNSKRLGGYYAPSLFEQDSPAFDAAINKSRGKLFVVDRDITGDGRINIEDVHWTYLEGDGDSRSDEVKRLRDEVDVVITNPPFSMFREFLAWIVEAGKAFAIIIKHSRHKEVRGKDYQRYDNYDAIEVPFTDAIPSDYDGVMGVPISFMDKYCPEQFEIVGLIAGNIRGLAGIKSSIGKDGPYIDSKLKYGRVLVRFRVGGEE